MLGYYMISGLLAPELHACREREKGREREREIILVSKLAKKGIGIRGSKQASKQMLPLPLV